MIKKSFKDRFLSREFIVYLITGVIVTLTNWIIYSFLITTWNGENWRLANFISIILSIVLAYILNRKFVFKSQANILPEILYFFVSRIVISTIFEHGIMELMINVLHFNPTIRIFKYDFQIIKIIGSVFVVIGNYLIGKFLVFSHLDKKTIIANKNS